MKIRTYTELSLRRGLEERFDYLSLGGTVGRETFGFDRWMNQKFYRSREWMNARDIVLVRDDGFDLGDPETPIRGQIYVHHMNPLTVAELEAGGDSPCDPEFLISTSLRTHNAIHYGDRDQLPTPMVERSPGDTLLW